MREEEKQELARLIERVPIPVKENVEEPTAKTNVLLQAYISQLKLEGFSLLSDMVYITQSSARLMRCLHEIVLKRGWASLAERLLGFCKMIDRRMWLSQSPLRQFKGIPEDIIKKIEKKDFPWERFYDLTPPEIGELVRFPKMGKMIHRLVHQFPRLELSAHVQVRHSRIPPRMHCLAYPTYPHKSSLLHTCSRSHEPCCASSSRSRPTSNSTRKSTAPPNRFTFSWRTSIRSTSCTQSSSSSKRNSPRTTTRYPSPYRSSILSHRSTTSAPCPTGGSGRKQRCPSPSDRSLLPQPDSPKSTQDAPTRTPTAPTGPRFLLRLPVPIACRQLILPDKYPPHTELLDLQPLPISALGDAAALYASSFSHFNPVQTQTFSTLFHSDDNVLVGAPTGSCKTTCAEFALLRMIKANHNARCVYIAPLPQVHSCMLVKLSSSCTWVQGALEWEKGGAIVSDRAWLASRNRLQRRVWPTGLRDSPRGSAWLSRCSPARPLRILSCSRRRRL